MNARDMRIRSTTEDIFIFKQEVSFGDLYLKMNKQEETRDVLKKMGKQLREKLGAG